MSRIFISYKRADKDKVFKIKDQIESALGEKCWIDIDGIESDAQFKNVIINAINECEIVLFMYSKAHSKIVDFENDWTVRELNFAASKNKRIVFINLDGSSLTDAFSFDYGTKQQVSGYNKQSIVKLIHDIQMWLCIPHATTMPVKKLNKIIRMIKNRSAWSILFLLCFLTLLFHKFLITDNSSSVDEKFAKAIDLGLPSGILWASNNIGAINESDYGNYYAWGECNTKKVYNATNYFDTNDSTNKTFKKYQHENGLIRIVPEDGDDIARNLWGSKWRIPSPDDFRELIECCKFEWKDEGCYVTGPNNNSIFLPAGGFIADREYIGSGEDCYYITSYLGSNSCDESPTSFEYDKDSEKTSLVSGVPRYFGTLIRPVADKP